MALLLFPSIADNRKTSLIRLISDLGLGIAVPRLKKRATIRAITSMSAADSPHPGGGEIIGLRWRFRRPQVALSIGPGRMNGQKRQINRVKYFRSIKRGTAIRRRFSTIRRRSRPVIAPDCSLSGDLQQNILDRLKALGIDMPETV
jgi:hypothetical protein